MHRTRCLAAAALLLLLLPAALQAYEVPKEITIKRPEKNPPMAVWVNSVTFPHGKHAVLNACSSCHHEESDRSLGQFLPCSQCHNKPTVTESTSFYLAWHNDRTYSCLGCHRKVRQEQRGMPPLSCTRGCHKKTEAP